MEKTERPISPTAKVYFINKDNIPLIEQGEKVAYSKDNQFALTYTKEDVAREVILIEAREERERIEKRSYEDEIYEWFLEETGVEKGKIISKGYKHFKVDSATEMIIEFISSEPFPMVCIINKLNSIKGGSSVTFIQASANDRGSEIGLRVQIADE